MSISVSKIATYKPFSTIFGLYMRSDGVLCCLYQDQRGYFITAHSENLGLTWNEESYFPPSINFGGEAIIGFDNKNKKINVNYNNGVYFLNRFPCDIPEITKVSDTQGEDDNNILHFFNDKEGGLYCFYGRNLLGSPANPKYIYFNGTSWSIPVEYDTNMVYNPQSIIVDDSNILHSLKHWGWDLTYRNNEGGTPHDVCLIDYNHGDLFSGEIFKTSSGSIICYYYHYDTNFTANGNYLKFGKFNGSTFDTIILKYPSINQLYINIKITQESTGRINLFFKNNIVNTITFNRFYSDDDGETWSSEELIESYPYPGGLRPAWFYFLDSRYPSYNSMASGFCGIFKDINTSDIYFFKSDDASFKKDPTGAIYCIPLDVVAEQGCINLTSTVVTGLSHLEGREVAILADGVVKPNQVVLNGQITLDGSYGKVMVGLPYISQAETLNLDFLKDGTIQGGSQKVSNVTFSLINSRGGKIGPDEDNLYSAFTTENLASAQEFDEEVGVDDARLFNVDLRVPLGAGYSSGGRMFIEQSEPLPMTITRIIPEVTGS